MSIESTPSRPLVHVLAERSEEHPRWNLTTVEHPGVFSAHRSLAGAGEYVREAIAHVAEVEPDSFDVEVVPVLDPELGELVRTARESAARLAELARETSVLSRSAVTGLLAAGLSKGDVATVFGVSPSRVSRLSAG